MQFALPVVQSRRNARGLAVGVCLSSTTTGPLTRSREDTEGAATERSSRVLRVHGQDSGLRRLQPAVRIYGQRAGLLRPEGLLRPQAMRSLPERTQGVAAGRRKSCRRIRWRQLRSRTAAVVPRDVQPVWPFDGGPVPTHQRQARLLQRLLPERSRQLVLHSLSRQRPRLAGVVSCPGAAEVGHGRVAGDAGPTRFGCCRARLRLRSSSHIQAPEESVKPWPHKAQVPNSI